MKTTNAVAFGLCLATAIANPLAKVPIHTHTPVAETEAVYERAPSKTMTAALDHDIYEDIQQGPKTITTMIRPNGTGAPVLAVIEHNGNGKRAEQSVPLGSGQQMITLKDGQKTLTAVLDRDDMVSLVNGPKTATAVFEPLEGTGKPFTAVVEHEKRSIVDKRTAATPTTISTSFTSTSFIYTHTVKPFSRPMEDHYEPNIDGHRPDQWTDEEFEADKEAEKTDTKTEKADAKTETVEAEEEDY